MARKNNQNLGEPPSSGGPGVKRAPECLLEEARRHSQVLRIRYAALIGTNAILIAFIRFALSPDYGTLGRIYVVVLAVVGVASALLLLSTTRSYMTAVSTTLRSKLALAGSVVVVAFTIAVGLMLPTRSNILEPSTFNSMVRVFDQQGRPMHTGEITLRTAQTTMRLPINEVGEAEFRQVPSKFRGTTSEIIVEVPGYFQDKKLFELTDSVMIRLRRAPAATSTAPTSKPF